jgi:signal transduction histidine kinase
MYVINELQALFANHPVAAGKQFIITATDQQRILSTDSMLVIRVLTNMLLNAFEASDPGGTVWLWMEPDETSVTFCVRNTGVIPQDIQLRIFQRYFSTKQGI